MRLEQFALDLLSLSVQERAQLATKLIASLEDKSASHEDLDKIWANEAERRLREIADDKLPLREWSAVLADIKMR